jgi:hypothetical protein
VTLPEISVVPRKVGDGVFDRDRVNSFRNIPFIDREPHLALLQLKFVPQDFGKNALIC